MGVAYHAVAHPVVAHPVAHHAVAHHAVAHPVAHHAVVAHPVAHHAVAHPVAVAPVVHHAPVVHKAAAYAEPAYADEPYTYQYGVALPDGRTQHVKYTSDNYDGYVADVTYEGVAAYPEDAPYVAAPAPAYHA